MSHGGSFVYYTQREGETCSDMFRRPNGGGPAEPLVVDTGVGAINPVASLDGRLLAYSRYICRAEGIAHEVVIRDLISGEETIVETDAHGFPEAFDASGRRLLLGGWGPDGGWLHIYDLATGESRPVELAEGCSESNGFWLTDAEIALQQNGPVENVDAAQLVFLDPSNGRTTRPAFEIPESARVAAVDRTGRWLAASIFPDPHAGPYTESRSIIDLLSGEVVVAGLPAFPSITW